MEIKVRRQYREVRVDNVIIGGNSPVTIQSMTNIPFDRYEALENQAFALQKAGCEILRVSVPDEMSAEGFKKLKNKLDIPLVADIHFNYKLALASIDAGADKIRINPGNIGTDNIKSVVRKAVENHVPIRVGINSGSLEKEILSKYGSPTAEALAESAMKNVKIVEECGCEDIVVSIKSSNVNLMVDTYRIFDQMNENRYPLHLGVTEAGTLTSGLIKNSVGIGSLLLDGIGSTIRYSLSADPIEEIYAANKLLRFLGLRNSGVEIVSCPTCGRTTVNTIELANKLESSLRYIKKPIKIAVMGCVVNGIGEAAESDFGVTGANGKYLLFKKVDGEVKIIDRDISEADIFERINNYIKEVLL